MSAVAGPPRVTASHVPASAEPSVSPLAGASIGFHRSLPGYATGRLCQAPRIAAALGLRRVWIKDETTRFGLPAYKMLGAAYAAHRALGAYLNLSSPLDIDVLDMAERVDGRRLTLVAPTDGNHGRAIARYAAMLGLRSHVIVPHGTARARVEAIDREPGGCAEVVPASYLGAVRRAVELAEQRPEYVLVTDFDGEGTGPTPGWVIDGYSTIFAELDDQLRDLGASRPSSVVVQVGAGALACAVARWAAAPDARRVPMLSVEPADAACLLVSLQAGQVATLPGPFDSVMAGLNCDAPSALAFEELRGAVNAAIAVQDSATSWAMRALSAEGIEAGESGAAGVAGLAVAMLDPTLGKVREACGLDSDADVLVFVTEQITDPESAAESLSRTCPDWPALW